MPMPRALFISGKQDLQTLAEEHRGALFSTYVNEILAFDRVLQSEFSYPPPPAAKAQVSCSGV